MKLKIAAVLLITLCLAAGAAQAETVKITANNYDSLGWTKTLKTGPEPGQAVNFEMRSTTTPKYVGAVTCSPKKSQSNNLAWAGLSANLFEGRLLSEVTHFRIRTCGFEGDGSSWEPPSIYLQGSKDGLNQRNIRFLPYASTSRGASWTFYEYDLMGPNSKWFCMIDGTVRTWQQVLAAWPNWQFDSTVTTPLPSGQTFNVFNGCAINQEVTYGSSARGMVDWVEIGFSSGEFYRFDFGLEDYALNNAAAKDPVAGAMSSKAAFVVYGKILSSPAPGVDDFYIDDGSGSQVKVNAAAHGLSADVYVRAVGKLNNAVSPPELTASEVNVLYP